MSVGSTDGVAFHGLDENRAAGWGQLVIAPRRPLLILGDGCVLPMSGREALSFEATKNRIDGTARQIGLVKDVEAVTGAVRERV